MSSNRSVYPCLWFNGMAKEAAEYYCSVFSDSKIISCNSLVTIFELNGSRFMALNGGPNYKFNEAVSFVIPCETQEEINYYWNRLAENGEESMCGWLKDRYGVSWQIVPSGLASIMNDGGLEKQERVMKALLQMKKLNIRALMEA